jgi:hypothetical protein
MPLAGYSLSLAVWIAALLHAIENMAVLRMLLGRESARCRGRHGQHLLCRPRGPCGPHLRLARPGLEAQAGVNSPSDREYDCLMRVKTSITLPADLIARLDRVDKNRSAVLERAARSWLAQVEREARDRLDLEIIEKNATRMNRDAEENLSYQSLP